jgi:hypothetical protein
MFEMRTVAVLTAFAAIATAEPPTATEVLLNAPPAEPAAPATAGQQQHWVAVNLLVLQPTVGRVQLKVWDRPQNSLWLEAFGGSSLFEVMYGFGARVQHTAAGGRNGDALFLSPGFGVHILPTYTASYGRYEQWSGGWNLFGSGGGGRSYGYRETRQNSLAFLAADVDVSWVHDFHDHFAFELGCKLGLAFKIKGDIGEDRPSLMSGDSVYPILAIYSGFRF